MLTSLYETDWITGPQTGYAWDRGVTWRTRRIVAPTDVPIDLDYLTESVLRVSLGVDDARIEQIAWQASEAAEHKKQCALMPQTWEQILDQFPSGAIRLERPPLIEVVSIAYVDADGNTQTLTGSPAQFQTIMSGEYAKAEVVPLPGASWPATRSQRDAVTVTFRAGYADAAAIPHLIRAGLGAFACEIYENPGLLVEGRMAEGALKLDHFWPSTFV